MDKLLQNILNKLDGMDALDGLSHLSGSELNSFLLEMFRRRATLLNPPAVLSAFEENRFVTPARIDPIESKELELAWLRIARDEGEFTPITLSPVAPMGSCSAFAHVNQNKVLSSIRGTEVVADATNVLMLQIAANLRKDPEGGTTRYSTIHRHVRGQSFDNPDYAAHFAVYCQASAGVDPGNYEFEILELQRHISVIIKLLTLHISSERLSLKIFFKDDNENFQRAIEKCVSHLSPPSASTYAVDFDNKYYQRLQFKISVSQNNTEIDIADGGFVDWPQKISGNKKLRGMISGVGLELLQKLFL